jgi:hypothetical protein
MESQKLGEMVGVEWLGQNVGYGRLDDGKPCLNQMGDLQEQSWVTEGLSLSDDACHVCTGWGYEGSVGIDFSDFSDSGDYESKSACDGDDCDDDVLVSSYGKTQWNKSVDADDGAEVGVHVTIGMRIGCVFVGDGADHREWGNHDANDGVIGGR